MGFISKVFKTTVVGAAATTGTFYAWTRNSQFVPFPPTDPLLSSAAYIKNNPDKNPATQDYCIRKVPLSKIKPELQGDNAKLTEAFCAGVWSGAGYEYQRRTLSKRYEGPLTAHQLWSTPELRSSTYEVGTQITDHFEVLEKTPTRIVVRCGDSPMVRGVRASDGLFEMSANINKEEGVVVFGLKSVFYQGLGKAEGKPMPAHVEFLHRLYTKLWMETALKNVEQ